MSINPVTGLPMVGNVDVSGNPYGTSNNHERDFTMASNHSTYFDLAPYILKLIRDEGVENEQSK